MHYLEYEKNITFIILFQCKFIINELGLKLASILPHSKSDFTYPITLQKMFLKMWYRPYSELSNIKSFAAKF
ncbi:hypothetical protein H376_6350 [Rickettsia prowazekii str. GvF12]|nr:hypothetical protein H376_6350 [Rickettsia prowazekii str. GvF12]